MSTTKALVTNLSVVGSSGQFLRWRLFELVKFLKNSQSNTIKPIQVSSYDDIYVAPWSLTL